MKNKLYILFLVFGALWACSDEPEFPDPGLDSTRTSIDTVRRDTIDSYRISMDISAPNGVEKIQVLNGRNYDVVQEFAREYHGKKNFTFEYDVDLREIVNDTTLLYIVKVIDRNMRSYNKGFTLNVKKFSSPDIKIVGGTDVLGLVSSVFELKARFETGLNTIASYRVFFEGDLIDEGDFSDTLVHEYKYKHVVDVTMEMERDYLLRVELTDSKGVVGWKEMKLRLVEMKRPVKITVSTESMQPARELELYYNEEDRLDSMLYTIYSKSIGPDGYTIILERYFRYDFKYIPEGMVSEWVYTNLQDNEVSSECVFTYEPGSGRLKTVDSREGNPKNAIDVKDWYSHDGVKSYYYGTNSIAVEDIHYTPELKGNGFVFSEFWVSNKTANYRQHCEDMTSMLIPTYFPELPNVIMGSPDVIWQDLFLYKYVFGKTVYTNKEEESSWVTSSTDSQGRLTTMRRSKKDSYNRTTYYNYVFFYE